MQRMGMIIGVKPDKIDEYKRLHAAVWPEVLTQIKASNIRNYSIFLREPENLLFGYWEYYGTDFETDMAQGSTEFMGVHNLNIYQRDLNLLEF